MKTYVASFCLAVAFWASLVCGVSASEAKAPPPIRSLNTQLEAISEPSPEPAHGFAYDAFENGSAYPGITTVDLVNSSIPEGAMQASIVVRLTHPSPNTVLAYIRCFGRIGGQSIAQKTRAVIFRPGDPLSQQSSCELNNPAQRGDSVYFLQDYEPDGALRGQRFATAKVTQDTTKPIPNTSEFRPPYRFEPKGDLIYTLKSGGLRVKDEGAANAWASQLRHGRSQPANSETGYYGTLDMGAISDRPDGIHLNSLRLETPVDANDGRPPYPFQASVLSAHNTSSVHFDYGSIQWTAKMPSRLGTWPALWLLPTEGWPPEIDVYEGFSHNPDFNHTVGISSTIHGGQKRRRTFARSAFRIQLADVGQDSDVTNSFHDYQVKIAPNWITMYFDGIETMRFANPFQGKTWYPIMTVAVKADPDDPYAEGSGDMVIQSMNIWSDDQASP